MDQRSIPIREQPAASQRYRSIAHQLMSRITAGDYSVGALLPREVDLAVEFGASRTTIREAMRLLMQDGLIRRRKRLGTVVCSTTAIPKGNLSYDPVASPSGLGRTTKFIVQVSDLRTVPSSLIPEAVGAGFLNWHHMAGVRTTPEQGEVLCITEFFLHPKLAAAVCQVGEEVGLVYERVERRCGIRLSHARSLMVPCRITKQQAAIVGAPRGSLAIQIVRRFSSAQGELLEVVNTICPANRILLETIQELPSAASLAKNR